MRLAGVAVVIGTTLSACATDSGVEAADLDLAGVLAVLDHEGIECSGKPESKGEGEDGHIVVRCPPTSTRSAFFITEYPSVAARRETIQDLLPITCLAVDEFRYVTTGRWFVEAGGNTNTAITIDAIAEALGVEPTIYPCA